MHTDPTPTATDATATDPTATTTTGRIPTDVPDGAASEPCPYCERPLPTERLWALHLGERHADRLTPDERAAVEEAEEAEIDDLFVYHLKVVALIVLVVMGLSYVYAFALA